MRQKATQRQSGKGMARKDGSDHKHEWEHVALTAKAGDLADVFDRCHRCGLRARKGQTQHPSYADKEDKQAMERTA